MQARRHDGEPFAAFARYRGMTAAPLRALVAVSAAVAASAGAARAEPAPRGELTGRIVDKDSAEQVVGATVVVTGVGLTATEITGSDGRWRMQLPRGDYRVEVYYGEHVVKHIVAVPQASDVISRIDTELDIIACSFGWMPPFIDIDPDETVERRDGDRRGGDDLGAFERTVADVGWSLHGGADGSAVRVDGVPGSGDLSVYLTREVIARGYGRQARHGDAIGGVLEATTASGTNVTRGAAQVEVGRGRANAHLELGGPVKEDHAWYFVGLDPRWRKGDDGERDADLQMLATVNVAATPEHQGYVAGVAYGDRVAATAGWVSKLNDSRTQLGLTLGVRDDDAGGAGGTLETEASHRFRAAGHHTIAGGLGVSRDEATRVTSAYAQDSWQLRPNLLIDAGVRADRVEGLAGPCPGGAVCAAAPGVAGAALDEVAVSPRLGLAYDWTREGRSRLYGFAGRYVQTRDLEPGIRALPTADEAVAGVEYEVADQLAIGAAWIGRRWRTADRDENAAVVTARRDGRRLDLHASYAYYHRRGAAAPPLRPHDLRLETSYRVLRLAGLHDLRAGGRLRMVAGDRADGLRSPHRAEAEADLHLGYYHDFNCAADLLVLYVTMWDVAGDREAVFGARLEW